jgi:hypothetical protein
MNLKNFIGVLVFFFSIGFAHGVNSNSESLFSFFKESCRAEKGWHAEYSLSVEEKKEDKSKSINGTVDLLLFCPRYIRFSFSEKNSFFEFISDSVQAWIVRQRQGEKVRAVEQYNSLSKRGINSWLSLFSKALESKELSLGDFNNFLSVEKVKTEKERSKRFEIQNRKNLEKLTIDFGRNLEPYFDEILFEQKNYSFMLKFQKKIDDKKSTDLKSYNFYAQPGDNITLFHDKAE